MYLCISLVTLLILLLACCRRCWEVVRMVHQRWLALLCTLGLADMYLYTAGGEVVAVVINNECRRQ